MLRTALRTLGRRITGCELVGSDAVGNQYLRQVVKDDAGEPRERRWVEPPPALGRNYYNADSVPPEWHQW